MKLAALLVSLLLPDAVLAETPAPLPEIQPEAAGMDSDRLALIDELVADSLEQNKMPGCVVFVGRREGIVFKKAYGFRQTQPQQVPMTLDTVFDLASLTKPIATATSIMLLVQQEKLSLDQTVASILPEFSANGKDRIKIRHLLTHTSGLLADNSIDDYANGPEQAFARIDALELKAEPGAEFIYSDVGFIVLGRIVHAVSGQSVHEFSQACIYKPLGMNETGYLPGDALKARAAVTEERDGHWMQGEVHDPRAFALGGIAGHAGLFSTADDLARYATMMLNQGQLAETQILRPDIFSIMTTPVSVPRGWRTLGWDSRTGYSSNRGDLMSSSAFGHGGFTGTGIWIDPHENLFLIFLSNRVHPDGKGLVNPLIGRIGTVAGAAVHAPNPFAIPSETKLRDVRNGIDVLQQENFDSLKGRKVGLITNQTGLNRDGVSTIRLLHEAPGVQLVTLFSPEHGLEGKLDIPKIGDQKDSVTGLNVFSLYGETRTPTAESLQDIDTLVFDIQDIGCRFYTYVSTMGGAMQAAARHKCRFVVLDRVNPIGGSDVEGPVLDEGAQSFVGFHTLPVRHGMTAGELARMFQTELKLDLDLQVVKVEGWDRHVMFDETGLTWTNPSPNMRNLTQALLYPGVGLLEMTNVSVGRGTDTPFEILGAPWIKERDLAAHLNQAGLRGVRFVPVRFTPESSKFANESCGGVNLIITDRFEFHPLPTGIQLMCSLRALYPEAWDTKNLNRLLSSQRVHDAILQGESADKIEQLWSYDVSRFHERRRKFLLYP